MAEKSILTKLNNFKAYFDGEIHTDDTMRILYSTDASLYRKMPLAVAYPKTDNDLKNLVLFCKNNQTSLIPRTAGTSLGGQCVGEGIVVDTSKYLNQIIEINVEEKYAIVQPGVVRDELNIALKEHGLIFGPNTSTSNRAMIGGMVGNNSSGSYSIKYGTTRENIISLKGYLSDGSFAEFGELTVNEFRKKSHGTSLESAIYRQMSFELNHPLTQSEIDNEFPKSTVTRRNTGYAIDFLLNTEPFYRGYEPFNFSKMLCGSEGTLMLFSEIKVKLIDKLTDNRALICAHFDSLDLSLLAAVEAMKLSPNQCELMDKFILDCTKENIVQSKNRFFIHGDPQAILMIEVEESLSESRTLSESVEQLKSQIKDFSFHFSVLYGDDMTKAMQLRAAGLGVLQNVKGDDRPIEFVEDTAVAIADLPEYIREFNKIISDLGTSSVFYAHAGAGELHTRPKVNLKTDDGRKKFRQIAEASAHLIKKYRGSLSGEHGDGIVRAEFIPIVVGQRNYELFKRIKQTWDPFNIFNPGKIVLAHKMDENLRENYEIKESDSKTLMNFDKEGDWIKATEKCSGSGDCLKSDVIGGTLCPSYQATRDEKHSTRARANILREFFTHSSSCKSFQSEEIKDVLNLCLSCKACLSECPSSVDMAAMKSEFLFQYHKTTPRSRLEKNLASFNHTIKLVSKISFISNLVQNAPIIGYLLKKSLGIDPRRSLPKIHFNTFEKWSKNNISPKFETKVYLYVDEFSNYLDSNIAIQSVKLLNALNIEVILLPFHDSSRSLISKGYLEEAKTNINGFILEIKHVSENAIPLIGIEPSAILGIRDDYERLIDDDKKEILNSISKKTYIIEEFLSEYLSQNPQLKAKFNNESQKLLYHGHCHQKSLSSSQFALDILCFPENYSATEIQSGCCGMAGSFGYEHYDLSIKIGEQRLFKAIRNRKQNEKICASGTSCRHQIKDGTKIVSNHPVEILYKALKK